MSKGEYYPPEEIRDTFIQEVRRGISQSNNPSDVFYGCRLLLDYLIYRDSKH